jgi:TetR/AcrR family transcriptional regulator, transcriptional repressor for nem operon
MKKSEITRHLIIEKAAALFNQKGYKGTSISDIMEETGLSKGGIYGSFKKEGMDSSGVKDAIAVAAFEHAVTQVYRTIGERTRVIENSLDKLKSVVYFYRESVLSPPVEGGCPIQNAAVDSDNSNSVLRAKVLAATNDWQQRIVKTLEKGMASGQVRREVNAEEFALLFIGTLEGGILLSRLHRSTRPFEVMSRQLLQMIENLRVPESFQ